MSAVGMLVVDYVVQRSALQLGKAEARQPLGTSIGKDALLLLIQLASALVV